VSGPVAAEDAPLGQIRAVAAEAPTVEVSSSREAEVGGNPVRRALPQRHRRTVGAWCFADHLGPIPAGHGQAAGIGPHPHIGLHTVTWLLAGELVHRDNLGSEQIIRPGQLNLMTAGRGVSHAEEPTDQYRGAYHGIQLWVAQPESTRNGDPAFEHHPALPEVELGGGVATVLVGELGGTASPARKDTALVGVDLRLRGGAAVAPLDPTFEHALVVLEGAVEVGGQMVTPGHLAYIGLGRDELALTTPEATRLLLLGGTPFESPIVMWWNFVGRSREEMGDAMADWNSGAERFGETGSSMPRIRAPQPPWRTGAT
jgi:redox-sensitive bicupin YhaK (pirin superfamily)